MFPFPFFIGFHCRQPLCAVLARTAVLCPSPAYTSQAIHALTDVVRTLSAGEIPFEVVPHLCGAYLLASGKKSGGLRPIAVGEVMHHLISKCLSWVVRPVAVRSPSPLQLRVSVCGGCEVVVHSISRVVDEGLPNHWILLWDFSNAFEALIDPPCYERSEIGSLPLLLGWSTVMELCRSFAWVRSSSSAVAGFSRETPWEPWGFPLLCNPWWSPSGPMCQT